MRANWRDGDFVTDYEVVSLRRGQFLMGRNEMSEDLGCGVQMLRTLIERLTNLQELTTKPTTRGTVVTVVNYNLYIDDAPTIQPPEQPTANQPVTSGQPAANHLQKAFKKQEEAKDVENNNTPNPVVVPAHLSNLPAIDRLSKDEIEELHTSNPALLEAGIQYAHEKKPEYFAPYVLRLVRNPDWIPSHFRQLNDGSRSNGANPNHPTEEAYQEGLEEVRQLDPGATAMGSATNRRTFVGLSRGSENLREVVRGIFQEKGLDVEVCIQ